MSACAVIVPRAVVRIFQPSTDGMARRGPVQGCALASKIEKTRDRQRAENPILIQSRSQAFGSIGILAGKKTEQGQCNDLQIEG